MSDHFTRAHAPGHFDGDGCVFPSPGHFITTKELDVMNAFSSLSSAALSRLIEQAEDIIRERGEEGVFD